ncbi:MAG: hypothetical protein A2660_00820 [Candidatus Doudnabacteria bacterium RIFCSPHIGHO2_01_FULL_45_18]|uniref:Uncharacterized protein n=1 Tax=Candidatus Doudnabacteria bacterium RIFCSPHIGHO2_01_FULL_45_18 TaxID=1817823 RepID=A0A1F5NSL6_9BACT|nr:MAG: hypothetical protein A2660_00820 [Candidatus Doudnabacteria bacterium RIFCSPHIGHO2_01_FULL_45_18]
MQKFFEKYSLGIIVLIAVILRIFKLRYAFYGHTNELARDLLVSYNFLSQGDIPLLGPSASLGGFNFGAFYYYLLAPFVWLSHYYAWGAIAASGFFSVAQVVMLYFLLKLWFQDKVPALLGAFLLAISMYDIQNAYYVSNPNLMPFFILVFFYCLTKIIQGAAGWKTTVIAGVSLGLATQLHATALLILPVVYVLSIFLYRKIIQVKGIMITVIFAALTYIPYLVYELQHDFINTFGIFRLGEHYFSFFPHIISLKAIMIFWYSLVFFKNGYFDFFSINKVIYLAVSFLFVLIAVWVWYKIRSFRGALTNSPISTEGNFLLLTWMTVGTLIFVFFQGRVPEFYFLVLWPIPLIYFAYASSWLYKNFPKEAISLLVLFMMAQAVQLYYFFPQIEKKEMDYDNYKLIFDFTLASGDSNFKVIDDTGYPYFLYYYAKVAKFDGHVSKSLADTIYFIVQDQDSLSVEPPHYIKTKEYEFSKYHLLEYQRGS